MKQQSKTRTLAAKKSQSQFVCNLSALTPDEREQHRQNGHKIFHAVQDVKELPNGYAFQLPADSSLLVTVALFIEKERLCCPFFHFVVEVDEENGPMWVHVTGREGVKPFIRNEFELDELIEKR